MKVNWFCKMIPWDELGEFYDSIVFSRWNTHVYSTALICGLGVYIVEALDLVYLVLQYERRTLSKIIFKIKYLANLLWIVWYDYMKICEWLLGVEYDVYLLLVNAYMLIDGDNVGECIYVGDLLLNLCIVCHRFMHHML